MRHALFLAALAVAIAAAPAPGGAWEAATTHAGLTEQAALAARLHLRLTSQLGLERGLFSELTIPPADAPALMAALKELNPTHGHVPDGRGRLSALGWLAAGSVLADTPPAHAANHFFDPTTGRGLDDATLRGLGDRLRHGIYTRLVGDSIIRSGMPAIDWIRHAQNPMNIAGFLDQYGKAVSAATPGERQRHAAGALLAAGAILHVLEDMGSPSHVRDDLAAHVDVVGRDGRDVGSRFERIAALSYGRLGVPAPPRPIDRPSLPAFFTDRDHGGLADRTAARWFSAYTLPRSVTLRPGGGNTALSRALESSLVRPFPSPRADLDTTRAREVGGATLIDDAGVCVARYQVQRSVLSFYLDDACVAEQIAVILPEVAAYSAGLLDHLFRGTIVIERSSSQIQLSTLDIGLGAGQLEVFWDDAGGVRTAYGQSAAIQSARPGEIFVVLPKKLPAAAQAIAVLYRGVDQNNEPLVAAGYLSLAAATPAPPAQPALVPGKNTSPAPAPGKNTSPAPTPAGPPAGGS